MGQPKNWRNTFLSFWRELLHDLLDRTSTSANSLKTPTMSSILTEKYTPKAKIASLLSAIKSAEKKTFPASEVYDFETEIKKQNTTLLVAYRPSTTPQSTVTASVRKDKLKKPKGKAPPQSSSSETQLLGYALYIRTKTLTRLHKICVLEAFRKQGVGKALVERTIEEVRRSGAQQMDLWVDPQREPARALYKSAGFEDQQLEKDFYCKGRDAWRMSLTLEN